MCICVCVVHVRCCSFAVILHHPASMLFPPSVARYRLEWVAYRDRIGMWMCRILMYKT